MKTLELKLKKDVLIVDIPRLADYEFINRECKYLKVGNEEIKLNASTLDKFEFICKGSELTEEIASELVDKSSFVEDRWYHLAKRGFKANVESKGFYWLENPIKYKKTDYEIYADKNQLCRYISKEETLWQEAEEKTFRNPLIFVKK